jgi:hypothetical protein
VIKRAAILLGLPVALAVLVAVPLGLVRGEYQWLCAAVAVGVVVPPGVLTLYASERLFRSSLLGPLLALVVGTFGRLLLGYGGAALIFFASKPTFHADPISYWAWVLGLYLATLAVETALLAKPRGAAAG